MLLAEIYWCEAERNSWCRKFTVLAEATDGARDAGEEKEGWMNVAAKPHRDDELPKSGVVGCKKKKKKKL